MLSHSDVSDFVTSWIVACQTPLPMGILQARILEWVAMPSSKGSSQPRDQTQVSYIAGGFFTFWATREAPIGELNLKISKIWEHFAIEDMCLANKPMKRCSALVIREMHVKITRYQYTTIIIMTNLKKYDYIKCWWWWGAIKINSLLMYQYMLL